MIAAVIFLIATRLVISKTLQGFELAVFNAIYGLPHWLRSLMLAITQAGSTWMVIIAACIFAMRRRMKVALQVILVGIITFATVELVKALVARPRPFILLEHVESRERFVTGMGFPSGHAAVTTAVALVVLRYVPRQWRWTLLVWVGLVSISRIYLGVHSPLDIVGGIALGTVVAEYFWLVWPNILRRFKYV